MITGNHIVLEPLERTHTPQLCEIGLNPSLWEWTNERVTTPAEMAAWVERAIEANLAGNTLAFAVRHRETGKLCGCTRYMNYAPEHRRVEIGSTWYGVDFQRTAVNTETKLLLLRHAFSALEALRVELKTDELNVRSQLAIARLGAQREGVLRCHMVTSTGRVRNTVYFSIVRQEWPEVEKRLVQLLAL